MCNCRIDWVVCFRQDCPRAARLREIWQRQVAEAQRFMGDPRVAVHVPTIPDVGVG